MVWKSLYKREEKKRDCLLLRLVQSCCKNRWGEGSKESMGVICQVVDCLEGHLGLRKRLYKVKFGLLFILSIHTTH